MHYVDLLEQYLPVGDKPRRLQEYFYKTGEGTWRPAQAEEEREQKRVLCLTGVLRQIRRYAGALSQGMPPAPRDLPPNPASLADWIYQCWRAGPYEVGWVLYEKGGLRLDTLSKELRMHVEEDYQICMRHRAVAKAAGHGAMLLDLARQTYNDGRVEQEIERFKVWPTNADRAVFQALAAARNP